MQANATVTEEDFQNPTLECLLDHLSEIFSTCVGEEYYELESLADDASLFEFSQSSDDSDWSIYDSEWSRDDSNNEVEFQPNQLEHSNATTSLKHEGGTGLPPVTLSSFPQGPLLEERQFFNIQKSDDFDALFPKISPSARRSHENYCNKSWELERAHFKKIKLA